MREKGALHKIQQKYESKGQVCPDQSGKPLGFASCFTAFLALLFGLCIGLGLFFIECLSKWTKWNIPILDAYGKIDIDKKPVILFDEKDRMIQKLRGQVAVLKRKVFRLSQERALAKPWFESS